MPVKIVTDSTADLPDNLVRELGVTVVPQSVRFGDRVYRDGIDISRDELRKRSKAELDSLGGVMLKDETTCIRCAMCASRCPTHAIAMNKFEFYRECVTVPTRNEKILYHADGNGTR